MGGEPPTHTGPAGPQEKGRLGQLERRLVGDSASRGQHATADGVFRTPGTGSHLSPERLPPRDSASTAVNSPQ